MHKLSVAFKKLGKIFIYLPFLYINIAMASIESDDKINNEVKRTIASEHLIGVDYYEVTTKKGIVFIQGKIETDSQASKIIEIAQSIQGVKDVDASKLKVASSTDPLEDTYITAKVKGLYIREKIFKNERIAPWSIKVETKNGIVYLTGTAKNRQEINNAIRIPKTVKGVKRVQSHIELKK
jgi:hyperosmotically inducible protein